MRQKKITSVSRKTYDLISGEFKVFDAFLTIQLVVACAFWRASLCVLTFFDKGRFIN
jgi:hypothetical protein